MRAACCTIVMTVMLGAGCAAHTPPMSPHARRSERGDLQTAFAAAHPEVSSSHPNWMAPPFCPRDGGTGISEIGLEETPASDPATPVSYTYSALHLYSDGVVEHHWV